MNYVTDRNQTGKIRQTILSGIHFNKSEDC